MAAVIHTSGRTDAAQEFTSNRQLLHAAIDKFMGRRMRSLTLERLDAYYQRLSQTSSEQSRLDDGNRSRSRPTPAATRGWTRAISSGAIARSSALDTLKYTAEFLAERPRTAEGRPLLQRRHRLSDLRSVRQPERHRRDSRHAGRHHDGGARQRELLHGRPARARRHDERVHGDGRRRVARDWRAVPRWSRPGTNAPA